MQNGSQNDRSTQQGRFRLRRLVPLVLVATLALDLGLRILPPERVYFRAWEAACLFATGEGPFRPNFQYHRDRAYGDLSNLGNYPSLRQYRREIFTTDQYGFRNRPTQLAGDIPAAILVGDSYGAGSGVSDDETLSAQLTRLAQERVYNGAGAPYQWMKTRRLIERLHFRGGLVIWEVSERTPIPASMRAEMARHPEEPSDEAPTTTRLINERQWRIWTDGFIDFSPLNIFLSRGFRKLENGIVLPNPTGNLVVSKELSNGSTMLFLRSEVDNFNAPGYESPAYLAEVRILVHCTGNELLVVLVPDKYRVYYPLLRDVEPAPAQGEKRLNDLETSLRRLAVPVVNLTAPLRSQAAEEIKRGEYNYWLDDSHWNRDGIRTADIEILRAWNGVRGFAGDSAVSRNAFPSTQLLVPTVNKDELIGVEDRPIVQQENLATNRENRRCSEL